MIYILDDTFDTFGKKQMGDNFLEKEEYKGKCTVVRDLSASSVRKLKLNDNDLLCMHQSLILKDEKGKHGSVDLTEEIIKQLKSSKPSLVVIEFSLDASNYLSNHTINKKSFYNNLQHFIDSGFTLEALYYGADYENMSKLCAVDQILQKKMRGSVLEDIDALKIFGEEKVPIQEKSYNELRRILNEYL